MRTHERPYVAAPCPCGRWTWYELVLAPGLSLHERHCPRCRQRSLLLFRSGQFEAAVRLTGRDLGSIQEALGRLKPLTSDEAELVSRVAALLFDGAAPRVPPAPITVDDLGDTRYDGLHTVIYCRRELKHGGRCRGIVGVLPGRWVKLRMVAAGERVTDPAHGDLKCGDKRCGARYEVAQIAETRAA